MTDLWEDFEQKRIAFEMHFLKAPVANPSLLTRALTRKDKWEKTKCQELKENGHFEGLDTIGDKILDYLIIDHFAGQDRNLKPEDINTYRENYGKNKVLHKFSKRWMSLQDYVIWSDEEEKKERWELGTTVLLAHSFEAILGALYLDKGIEGVKDCIRKIEFFERVPQLVQQ
jgi:dsRNA-specific ribonuclease